MRQQRRTKPIGPPHTIVVTGGARGIGAATAAAFAARGASVAIGDLDGDGARRVADTLGRRCFGSVLDVSSAASIDDFFDEVGERFGPVDVLVNNAGIMLLGELAEESDAATIAQLDVNVFGTLRSCKRAIPAMRHRGSGHIINVASMAGLVPTAGGVTYSATKHAVVGLTHSLAEELAGTGIHVTVILPSVVDTPLAAGVAPTFGVPLLTPDQVADAIVRVVDRPRREVSVPAWLGPLAKAGRLLPRRAYDAVSIALGSAGVLEQADVSARKSYQRSAAASAPADQRVGTTP